jgi:hypothetical protein
MENDIMYRRGKRDGLAGLNMSSTSNEYQKGWSDGRRERIEKKLFEQKFGANLNECKCHSDFDVD